MIQRTPIHRSLYKPILFVGCERLPFIMVSLACGFIILQFQSLLAISIALTLYTTLIMAIRSINAQDMQFFHALYRYVRYFADYYPANAFYACYKPKKYYIE